QDADAYALAGESGLLPLVRSNGDRPLGIEFFQLGDPRRLRRRWAEADDVVNFGDFGQVAEQRAGRLELPKDRQRYTDLDFLRVLEVVVHAHAERLNILGHRVEVGLVVTRHVAHDFVFAGDNLT